MNKKTELKLILLTLLLLAFFSIVLLIVFLFSKNQNIVYIRLMSSILLGLLILFIVKWELYINNTEYRHIQRYQTESGCYKAAKPIEPIRGIVVSCTDSNSPYLKYYVEDNNELGYNIKKNHWNNHSNKKMPHEFIGYDKNGEILIVHTLPCSYSSLSCGNGINGSCDFSPNGYIKVCICKYESENEDYLKEAVFGAAVQICASLWKKYNLKIKSIISDKEAYELGIAVNHSDFEEWLLKKGVSMDTFRSAVKARKTPIMLFKRDKSATL